VKAPSRHQTARPALNPCGAGRGDQFECLNIFRECRPAPGSHQASLVLKLHRDSAKVARSGTKMQHGKSSRYPHSPNSNEAPLGPASHAGPVVTVRGQTTKQVLLGNVAIKIPRVASQHSCANILALVFPTPCSPKPSLIEIARHPCPTRVGILIGSLCHPHGWLFLVTAQRERAPAFLTRSTRAI